MRANLLNEPKKGIMDKWKPVLTVFLAVVVIAVMAGSYFQGRNAVSSLQQEIKGLDRQLAEIGSKRQEYKELQEKIKALQARSANYFWDRAVRELGYLVTEKTTLNKLAISGGRLSIEGFSAGRENFLGYLENFYASSVFRSVTINYLNRQSELQFKMDADVAAGDQ